jgi:uncharacterized protein involved in exopolysaccharide biosynthesis
MPAMHPGIDGDSVTVLALLWRKRFTILTGVLLGSVAGVAYAFLATEWFEAEVVMLPAAEKSATSGLSQLSGLASLAGISVDSQNTATEALAVLRSRDFSRSFIETQQLIQVLNASNATWKALSFERQRDIEDATEYFQKYVFAVTESKRTGEITLAINWTNRVEAANWANMLANRINNQMQSRALAESTRNIQYLQGEIARTNVAALQQSLGKVLESEMQKFLMARGSEEYSFKVVDHATIPKKRVSPQRAIVMIAGFLTGLALAVLIVLSSALLVPRLKDAA